MRRNLRPGAALTALMAVLATLVLIAPAASAQNTDEIVRELEDRGYYIESGAEASDGEMRALLDRARATGVEWYFVVLSGPADFEYAATLRDEVRPTGNVIVHSVNEDSQGLFDVVDLATDSTESIEERSLAAFDDNWNRPADYMNDVVDDFARLTSSNTDSSSSSGSSSSGGGGFPWWLIALPVAFIGGIWFLNKRGKKKKAESDLETAKKIRAELQAEIDELANDVLVLSGPVDVSENDEAINYYREATDTYLTISDEIPDLDELEAASLVELAEIGTRVAHARWQMDAAEAILDGEPIPEKPKVEPPPPPPTPPKEREEQREQQRQRMPRRQPRPRVPYSRSRSRSGGGLLDVLIAGGGMMASNRRRGGGGMFGGGSRSRTAPSGSRSPRPGGGVFGGGSARSSSRSSSGRRSTSRSSSRRSSGRRSTSRRKRR